jgi:uncharacterized protein
LNVIVVSHESDVDGVFSASIALMRFPQSKVFFTSYGKENFVRISDLIYREVIEKSSPGIVIFCDLGLNEDMVSLIAELFEFLRSNSWSIIWIDHHPWSLKALNIFGDNEDRNKKVILDKSGNKCASELIFEHLLNNNDKAKYLASLAHTSDFLLKDQFLPPLPELIVYYKTTLNFYSRLARLCSKISEGILWDTEMQADYRIYTGLRDQAKRDSWKKLQEKVLENGIKMAVVPTDPYIQTSLFSQEIFQETDLDVVFFLTKEGKVSIRRSNSNLNCNEIAAELLEGGGHAYAAGGKIRSDPLNLNEAVNELEDAVKNSLKKKSQ